MQQSIPSLFSWQANEFDTPTLRRNTLLAGIIILVCIIAYALISGSPIMAITFILIGMVTYMQLGREPRLLTLSIIGEGIVVDRQIYPFENVRSFSLALDEGWPALYLETNGQFMHSITLPLGDADPEAIREILSDFIPESKHEPSLVDIIGKVLHI